MPRALTRYRRPSGAGVSQGALQMGRYVARRDRRGSARARSARAAGFRYHDYGLDGHRGQVARGGGNRATALRRLPRLDGAWLALHITVLIGFRNRISVLCLLIYSYVFFRRGSRLITHRRLAMLPRSATGRSNAHPVAAPVHPTAPAPPLRQARQICDDAARASSACSVTAGVRSSWCGARTALLTPGARGAARSPGAFCRPAWRLRRRLIVDAVVEAVRAAAAPGSRHRVGRCSRACCVALDGCRRSAASRSCQSLLRAQLGQRVNVMILEKALTLELRALRGLGVLRQAHARAARGSSRPLSLVMRSFGLVQNGDLARQLRRRCCSQFSPWAVAVLLLARPAGVRRGGEVLRRRVPAVPLALARDAHADRTSRRCWRARTTPRRSSSSASGALLPRALPRPSSERLYE
mgnify:CR=1 FL=1